MTSHFNRLFIPGAAGSVELWAGIVIGIVAGWIYVSGSMILVRCKIDDVVMGVPVHLFSGMWSLLATGLLSSPSAMKEAFGTDQYAGWMYEVGSANYDTTLLTNQMIYMIAILCWTSLLMVPFFLLLNYKNWLRTDIWEEIAGLDVNYMQDTHDAKEEAQQDLEAYQSEVNRARKRVERISKRLSASRQSTSSFVSVDSADKQ